MARQKKDNHPITIRMEAQLYEKLNTFCEESGQPKTVAVERAVEEYVARYGERMKQIKPTAVEERP